MNIPIFNLYLHKPPKRFPRIPHQRLPARVWQSYFEVLKNKVVTPWREATERLIINQLPNIERQVELDRPGGMRVDSWTDDTTAHLNELSGEYDKIAAQSKAIAAGTFNVVDGVSHRQWYDIAKRVLGVDLFTHEPWIADEAKAFIHVNVDLIDKLKQNTVSDISRIVMGGFREGKRWETLKDEIMGTKLEPGVFDKVETRAELIARDQTTKLYADVSEKRQTGAGIEWFYWRTMQDERVVGTPGGRWPNPSKGHGNHYEMDGKVCKWNDPTVYADNIEAAKAGKWKKRTSTMPKGPPGKEYQCRCYGEPIFDTLFLPRRTDSIGDPRKDSTHGWIGFDIDGTLAKYDFKQYGTRPIGEPIPAMVDRLKRTIAAGTACKYFTARAESPEGRQDIREWVQKYELPDLEATNIKDHSMILLYDDRARQVEPNTGKVIGE